MGKWSATMWKGPRKADPGGSPPSAANIIGVSEPQESKAPIESAQINSIDIARRREVLVGFMDTTSDVAPPSSTQRHLLFAEPALIHQPDR
jgi:hypothetical protein